MSGEKHIQFKGDFFEELTVDEPLFSLWELFCKEIVNNIRCLKGEWRKFSIHTHLFN